MPFSLRVSKSPLTWVLTPPSLSRPKRSLELPGHNHAHQHWGLIHAPRKCANHPNLQAAKVSRQPGKGWDDKYPPSQRIGYWKNRILKIEYRYWPSVSIFGFNFLAPKFSGKYQYFITKISIFSDQVLKAKINIFCNINFGRLITSPWRRVNIYIYV